MRAWRALLRWFYSDFGRDEAEELATLSFQERSQRITKLIRGDIPDPLDLAVRRWRNVWDKAVVLELSFEHNFEEPFEQSRQYLEQTKDALNELRKLLEETPFQGENLPFINQELELLELELGIPPIRNAASLSGRQAHVQQVDATELKKELKALEAINEQARHAFAAAAEQKRILKEAEAANATHDEMRALQGKARAAEQRFFDLAERAFLLDKKLEAKVIVLSTQSAVSDTKKHFEAIAKLNVNFKQWHKRPAKLDPVSGAESASLNEPPNSAV